MVTENLKIQPCIQLSGTAVLRHFMKWLAMSGLQYCQQAAQSFHGQSTGNHAPCIRHPPVDQSYVQAPYLKVSCPDISIAPQKLIYITARHPVRLEPRIRFEAQHSHASASMPARAMPRCYA